MNCKKDKMERLYKVAHMYYVKDYTQGEIADILKVSRPLVSRMLREARNLGIVEIRIHQPQCDENSLLKQLCQKYGLQDGVLIPKSGNGYSVDQNLAHELLQYIEKIQPQCIGIGWGETIGMMAELLEQMPQLHTSVHTVCPLIGNSTVSMRTYHTDENVRMIAEGMSAQPKFLYAPAFPKDFTERDLLFQTNHYRTICEQWNQLDVAIIGIHEPSTALNIDCPLCYEGQSVGHMIGYSFDADGNIICPEQDYLIHIPLEKLKKCSKVIGICASNVSVDTLVGALKTGLLTHIFTSESLVSAVLSNSWNHT